MKKYATAYVLTYLLAMALVVLLVSQCKGQSIHLTPSKLTSQALTLEISYSGQKTTLGSVSMRLQYDPSIWTYDSCTAAERFDTTGMLFITPAVQAPGWFGISWFSASIVDTVWTDNRPMFTAYFTSVQEGCAPFHWMTPPQDNCELSDIDAVVLPFVQWHDTTICNLTTGIMPESGQTKPVGERFTLLGQYTPNGQFYVLNRKLYHSPKK